MTVPASKIGRAAERGSAAFLCAVGLLLGTPASAEAHGLFLTPSLPVPVWLFAVSAAFVVIISFAAIGLLWQVSRLADDGWHPVLPPLGREFAGPLFETLAGTTGVATLGLVIYAGFSGAQDGTQNFASVFVFIFFWVGIPLLSVLAGDVFRPFNPWRALGRAAGGLATVFTRSPESSAPPLFKYPKWLGRAPAALGIFFFAYLELVTDRTPHDVAVFATIYTAITLLAIALYGPEAWCRQGEAFSVYFNLYSRIGVFEAREGQLGVRRPLSGLAALERTPGTVLLLAVMIGTVSYDGASGSSEWQGIYTDLASVFADLGFGARSALRSATVVGMILFTVAAYAFYWIGVLGAKSVGIRIGTRRLALAFAPSLVPIALAYVLAHYLQLFAIGGQSIINVISNPLGQNLDIFGTAGFEPNQELISPQAFWYLEVGAIVTGHVLAVALAHDLALTIYDRIRAAIRSQYWMLGVMVGFTVFALWLVASASEL